MMPLLGKVPPRVVQCTTFTLYKGPGLPLMEETMGLGDR